MNRAMRRAERKSKPVSNQNSHNSEENSIVFESKSPAFKEELQTLSPEEEMILMSPMEEMNPQTSPLKKKRKSPQSQVTGGIEESADKPPSDSKKQSYAKDIKDLTSLYENAGALISLRDPLTGLIIIQSAEERATELINVAKHHKKFLEALRRIAKGGDYGACIMGHLSMIMAILAVHGRVPMQYAASTLEKMNIDPLAVQAHLEAKNGHREAHTSPV